ncbi:AAA family ATPase [Brachyspira pilosicoli]|uniref:AAA family ATPase n=1 Tax=Brachyspira pilosicoli TaxID=52584 RepID=UPI003006CA64
MENISNVKIEIENFKTFKDKIILEINDDKFVISIIGRNASGKSTIFEAIENLKKILTLENNYNIKDFYKPYLFDDKTSNMECYYSISWKKLDKKYKYYIKFNSQEIIEEILKNGDKTYFERNKNSLKVDKTEFSIAKGAISYSSLFLLSINKNVNNKDSKDFLDLFDIINDIGSNIQVYNKSREENFIDAVISNIKNEKISDIISEADPTLVKIISEEIDKDLKEKVENIESEDPNLNKNPIYKPYGLHSVNEKFYRLDFNDESEGTRKLFLLMPVIMNVFKNGSYLFIDELDSSIHQDIVVDIIIKLFNNKNLNKNNAKLIFSMHNLGMLFKKDFDKYVELYGIKAIDNSRKLEKIDISSNKETINTIIQGNSNFTPGIVDDYLNN